MLKAAGATSLLSSFLSFGLGLALAFALAVAAGISLLAVRLVSRQYTSLRMEPQRFSDFKGKAFEARLIFEGRKRGAMVDVSHISTQPGLDAEVRPRDDGTFSLRLKTKFAGRFDSLSATVRVSDVMGLFFSEEEVRFNGFLLDSLPTSLLKRPRPLPMAAISVGEAPSGSRGSAQEFYAIEDYDASLDTRGILWKRVAESPTEKLVARIGESNIPKSLTIGVVETATRFETQPWFMDLVCEALARIGREAVEYGITLHIVSEINGLAWAAEARTVSEVASCVLGLWSQNDKPPASAGLPWPDMVITGMEDTKDQRLLGLVVNRPSVVVTSSTPAGDLGRKVMLYSGSEDVSKVLQTVLLG
jgi:hypothetical protein